ncbi:MULTISPECIES: hypothetical protein [unclassified Burkholderia]|uniref:hypothetical protein n=1 Tax=unclassified Burkholderia TaxID=2613784 RepID=UPI002AB30706|nr:MULTISPECIES: hypothetical protein [unclassified Burkholderia]
MLWLPNFVVTAVAPPNPEALKKVGNFALAIFGLSVVMERASEVLLSLTMRKSKILLRDSLAVAKAGLINLYEAGVRSEKDVPDAKERVLTAERELRLHKLRTSQYALIFNLCLGLCVAFAGFRALRYFVDPPQPSEFVSWMQLRIFTGLDALLTAAVLAGGSKGVHTLAMTILRFANEINNAGTPKKRGASRTKRKQAADHSSAPKSP